MKQSTTPKAATVNYRAQLSRPPKNAAEAKAQVAALTKRDSKVIKSLAKY